MDLANILNTLYIAFIGYILVKFSLWFIKYLKLVLIVNKIPGPFSIHYIKQLTYYLFYKLFKQIAMLPFIGNAHQLKPGSGFLKLI